MKDKGFEWQVEVWDKMTEVYESEIDRRFVPVVDHVLARARLEEGQTVMDLGSGTGAVAFAAASHVGDTGQITAVDVSPDMLALVRAGAEARSLSNVDVREGRGEDIPVDDASHDAVLASLSLMYAIDRQAVAQEVARVLKPGGRMVASVWSRPQDADIVLLQSTAGKFAPDPPVPGVGPGALGDPSEFMNQLAQSGLHVELETEITEFEFPNFDSAWNALAAVTTAGLEPEIQHQAKSAVQELMWSDVDKPRTFSNATHFIVATK